MLACARIGAIHSVVFGGFAAHELATRIDDARPRVILAGVLRHRGEPDHPVQAAARRGDRRGAVEARSLRRLAAADVPGRAGTPAATMTGRNWKRRRDRPIACRCWRPIRSTSSTPRARPASRKGSCATMAGMPWRSPGRCATSTAVQPDEVFWTASDVGWVVGHSYIVYAPLIYGCTSVMYEGKPVGTPDAGAFWRVIAEHDVRVMFTAPTAFRAIKREDPDGKLIRTHDLRRFRALFLAGERADPPTVAWAEEQLRVPVIDHWWQTETGWPIGANCLGIEQTAGQARLVHPRRAGLGRAGAGGRGGRRGARDASRARSARWRSSCRCRPAPCRPCGSRTSASCSPISAPIPAITRPPMPASSTTTATST